MQCVMNGGIAHFLPVEFWCRFYVLAENDCAVCRTVGNEV
jgi:hypothetical protein